MCRLCPSSESTTSMSSIDVNMLTVQYIVARTDFTGDIFLICGMIILLSPFF